MMEHRLLRRFERFDVAVARKDAVELLHLHQEVFDMKKAIYSNARLLRILRLVYRHLCTKEQVKNLGLTHFTRMYLILYRHLLVNFQASDLLPLITKQWTRLTQKECIEFEQFSIAWFHFSEQWVAQYTLHDTEQFLLFAKRILLGDADPQSSRALKAAIGIADENGNSVVSLEEYLHCMEILRVRDKLHICLGTSVDFDPIAFIDYHVAHVTLPMYPSTPAVSKSYYADKRKAGKAGFKKPKNNPSFIQRGMTPSTIVLEDQDRQIGQLKVNSNAHQFTDWTYRTALRKQATNIDKPMRRVMPKTKKVLIPVEMSRMQRRLQELQYGYLTKKP